MLKRLQKTAAAIVLTACLVGPFGVAIWGSLHTPYSPQQLADPKATHAPESSAANENPENAIARYNYWLTWITFVLAIATMWLGGIGIFQIRLSRAEFNATHRPYIRIHTAVLHRRPPETPADETDIFDRIAAELICFNIGESTASRVEVRGQIFAGANFAIDVQRPLVKTFNEILSGQKFRAEITSDVPIRTVAMANNTGVDYYCVGWIAYWDQNGLRRETGFCFRVDLKAKPRESWVNANKPEYEYEY